MSSHDHTHVIFHIMQHNFLLEAIFWQFPFLLTVTALDLWLKFSVMVALSFNYPFALIPKTTTKRSLGLKHKKETENIESNIIINNFQMEVLLLKSFISRKK